VRVRTSSSGSKSARSRLGKGESVSWRKSATEVMAESTPSAIQPEVTLPRYIVTAITSSLRTMMMNSKYQR
jgi:hypothetical protein